MSMGASEYLAERSEKTDKQPLRASFYTGSAYLFTVFLLILPFLLIDAYLTALAVSLVTAITIIAVFNYYISIAMGFSFRTRFLEMAGLSMGVALLSFLVGIGVRILLGIET
jgi:VIT1/CCC1 family predicted Fe2+/Mn2+ transporter